MFDVDEMINESFFISPLQRAQKDGYVNITGIEGERKIVNYVLNVDSAKIKTSVKTCIENIL